MGKYRKLIHMRAPSKKYIDALNGQSAHPGWVSEKEYFEALATVNEKLAAERDRRYAEVKLAEEKALQIKATSDDKALLLARDIQDLKDEKANNLRNQIDAERGHYVTQDQHKSQSDKLEALIRPISELHDQPAGQFCRD